MKVFIHNFSWLFYEKILRIAIGISIGAVTARYLGPTNLGELAFSAAFISFFSLFTNFAAEKIVVREITKHPQRENEILGTSLILNLLGGAIAVLLNALACFFLVDTVVTRSIIIIFSFSFLFQAFNVIDFYFQSKVKAKFSVIARLVAFLLVSILKILIIVEKCDLILFAFVYLCEFIFNAIFFLLVYGKAAGLAIAKWRINKKLAETIVFYSWPIAFGVLLSTFCSRTDQIMIKYLIGNADVGVYSIAVRWSYFWLFIPGIIVSTVMPYFIRLREENIAKYAKHLKLLYSGMFWLGVLVAVFVCLVGEPLIYFLYGQDYIHAYVPLIINIWIGVFVAQSQARMIWFIGENLQIYRIVGGVVTALLNIVLNYCMISKYGIAGAAYASLFSVAIGTWGVTLLFKKIRPSTIAMMQSVILIIPLFKFLFCKSTMHRT